MKIRRASELDLSSDFVLHGIVEKHQKKQQEFPVCDKACTSAWQRWCGQHA